MTKCGGTGGGGKAYSASSWRGGPCEDKKHIQRKSRGEKKAIKGVKATNRRDCSRGLIQKQAQTITKKQPSRRRDAHRKYRPSRKNKGGGWVL